MSRDERNDREMHELFRAARRAERASAPGFESVRRAGRSTPAAERRQRGALRVAVLAVAGSAAVALTMLATDPLRLSPAVTRSPVVDDDATNRAARQGDLSALGPPPKYDATSSAGAGGEAPVDEKAALAGPTIPAPEPPPPPPEWKAALRPPSTTARRELAPPPAKQPAALRSVGYVEGASVSEITEYEAAVAQLVVAQQLPGEDSGSVDRLLHAQTRLVTALEQMAQAQEGTGTESYDAIVENDFRAVVDQPLSTFSIDVDTASYSNVRRWLRQGRRPPRGAVRIEELINYFPYDYPAPVGDAPFSATAEVADCPWNPQHRLARIGLKGDEVRRGDRAGSNLVFLVDVSGSMSAANKLPLLKSALGLLVDQLDGNDQVALVVYAGSSGLVLPSTSGADKAVIREAIDRLESGGGTNGGAGLKLAYQAARENFVPGGINRVVLATDGDFNVGVTSDDELLDVIRSDADAGIFLTALGFGMGNYKDDKLELLADRGNGNYAYIDTLQEARKVLVEQVGGTLVTIAKDVKIQIEFNPAEVGAYRLIGYENRLLAKEDFNDDAKDAGEIGAGHTVTALYELVPPGRVAGLPAVDALKYQTPSRPSAAAGDGELFTLKLRYKEPEGTTSRLISLPVVDRGVTLETASEDFRFAGAVALFGMLLRDSAYAGDATLEDVRRLTLAGLGRDAGGYRAEFHDLVGRAIAIGD